MKTASTPAPSPEPGSPDLPVWMPAQFTDESELPEFVQRRRARLRARRSDDYAGRDFTLGEIVANSVSQGVAAALSIAALVILVVQAVSHGAGLHLVAALVFAISATVSFVMSTLYHAIQPDEAKRVFKVLDNSSTYLLIAGAFTPYCLITLADAHGLALLAAEWGLALAGVVIEAVWATRPRWIHGIVYGVMCVVFATAAPALVAALAPAGLWLLVAAFVAVAASLVFRWFSSVPYLRFVFHIVSFAGLVCLFLSVVLFVV